MKRSCYSTRLSNDFLHGNAYHDWRIWKLNASFNDWSSRYGFPSSEQHQFLTSTSGISPSSSKFLCRARSGNRMNCVSAISWNSIPLRRSRRLCHFCASRSGSVLNFRSCELHYNGNEHASARNQSSPNAFIRMKYFSDSGSSVISRTCLSRSDYDALIRSKL